MNRKRKNLPALLAAALIGITSMLGACKGGSGGEANGGGSILNTGARFPIVNDPITLEIMTPGEEHVGDRYVWKQYEEMTGIKINWRIVPFSGSYETMNLAFASGDLPDAFLKCTLYPEQQARYGGEGHLLNLMADGRLEKYAPNFWAYMEKHPEIRASQTYPGGEIFSIPASAEDPATRANVKAFVNTRWMKAVGIDAIPDTTDGFYEMLKAFKTKDPNGNGKADEIPFAVSYHNLRQYMSGFFGLMNRGVHHMEFDMDEKAGVLRHIPSTNEYRQMLEYFNTLYGEGLLNPEMFTASRHDNAALVNQDRAGVYQDSQLGMIARSIRDDWEGMESLTGPNGHRIFSGVRSHLHSTGAFVITGKCKYPEAALRWVDYFYSDEGCLFYHYGVEGVTFMKQEDGTYNWTGDILSQIQGNATYDEIVGKYVPYGAGNNPSIMKYPYFSGAEMQPQSRVAAQKVWGSIPKEIWGFFNYTRDEQLDYDVILQDINAFVNEKSGEFITGRLKLNDNNWNEYLSTIKKMNVDRALAIETNAYNRYKAINGN